jgi:hypothetical protein
MSLPEEQKVNLKVQKYIREAEDDLVLWIQDALDNTNYNKSKKSNSKLEESQFRNLIRVADTTDSTEVIKNFLRYQVGRNEKEEKWGRGKGSLAERIINDIEGNIKQTARNIYDTIQSENGKVELKPIWLELIRRYLGYGARYLTYRNKGMDDE